MYWSRKLLLLAVWLAAAEAAVGESIENEFSVAADLFARQRWEAATVELTAFLANHSEVSQATDARFLLGESLIQLRRYREAREQLVLFLAETDEHRFGPQAEFRSAEAAFQLGDHVVARTELRAFRKHFPEDRLGSYAVAYLGELALLDGDGRSAQGYFEEALGSNLIDRMKWQCQFGLAQAYELHGEKAEALTIFSEIANSGGSYAERARCRAAVLHFRNGKYDEAARLLTPLARSSPASVQFESQYWLGMTQLAGEDWQAAAKTLRAGLAAAPHHHLHAARTFALAEALRKGGDGGEAVKHLRVLESSEPPVEWSDDAAQILIQIALAEGDLAAVHEGASRFQIRFPSSPQLPRILQLEGRAFLKEQDFDAAIAVFEQLLGAHEASPMANFSASPPAATMQAANRYYLAIAYLGADRPADVLRVLPTEDVAEGAVAQLADGLRVARASALLALGRYSQAIAPLEAYVSAHQDGVDSVDSHAKLVVALAETGQWYAAAESFQLFRERHPDSPTLVEIATILADRALAKDIHDVAEPLYQFLVTEHTRDRVGDGVPRTANAFGVPEHVHQGLIGLARSQFARGMAAEAAATTMRLLALSPPDELAASALLLRGQSLEAIGKGEAALECYQLVSRSLSNRAVASTAWYAAARVLTRQGRYEAASDELQYLLNRSPHVANRDTALYQQAWLYLDMNKPAEADRRFAELANHYPGSPLWADSVFRLARNAANRHDVVRAQRWIDELLFGVARHPALLVVSAKPAPDKRRQGTVEVTQIVCHALYLNGKLAVESGQWLAALRSYHRIVEEFPESDLAAAAAFWSAEALFQLAQFEQAEAMLAQQALATEGLPRERQAMIHLRRAQIAAHRQKWGVALAEAEVIEGRFPGFSLQFEVDYLVGRCLSTQARFSMARHAFRKVINSPVAQRTETAAMAQWMIGETYFHQSNYDDAIRAYYRVDELYDLPHWRAAALLQAAKCHELSGQTQVAQELYSQLRRQYPKTTYAAEANKRIRVANRVRPR